MQQPEFRQIKLVQLTFSTTVAQQHRRARFNKVALSELAANIKAVGIAQPILVRPFKDSHIKGEAFEIVAGERRVLAAKEAGLDQVPAMVRELSDEQLLELQIVENLQREDVHPMAEAEGYEGLRKLGRQIEDIMGKVGKSRSYVYGRMKLLDMCKTARTAFYDNKINASIALLIASLDPDKHQEKALAHILKPRDWNDEPLSFRDAAHYVRTSYSLDLTNAPFPIKGPELVAAAGPCTTCPKRAGNNPGLFPDGEQDDDTCTDSTCFQLKRQTYLQLQKDQASKSGLPLITGNEAKKIKSRLSSSLQNGFVRAGDKIGGDKKDRTYAQALKHISTGVAMLQDPEKGTFIKIYDLKDEDIVAALKEAGIQTSRPRTEPSTRGPRRESDAEAAARKEEKKRDEMYGSRLLRAVFDKTPRKLGTAEWREILDALVQSGELQPKSLVDLGLCETEAAADKATSTFDSDGLLKLVDEADLPRLAFAIVACEDLRFDTPKELEAHAKRLGIDPKAIRKAIDAETGATKATAPGKPAKPATAKSAAKPKGKAKTAAKKKAARKK